MKKQIWEQSVRLYVCSRNEAYILKTKKSLFPEDGHRCNPIKFNVGLKYNGDGICRISTDTISSKLLFE